MKYRLWKSNKEWEFVSCMDYDACPEVKRFDDGEIFETKDINLVYRFLQYLSNHYSKTNLKHTWEIKEIE